jgi:hypothetical protein
MSTISRTALLVSALLALAGCEPKPVTVRYEITGHGLDRPDPICEGFRLTPHQAEEFFAKAKPISPEQMHNEFEYMPCWVSGRTVRGSQTDTWKIRPTGIAEVGRADGSSQLLGCWECDDLFR